jgi:hypothetical protein
MEHLRMAVDTIIGVLHLDTALPSKPDLRMIATELPLHKLHMPHTIPNPIETVSPGLSHLLRYPALTLTDLLVKLSRWTLQQEVHP